ncbi:hypothetical protein [Ammoniphilus sp. 3BR4]|uniref:hypothetical protein n=1 Tax=Ammoniphilus sp. 3BR4 TaxID=3158265 RepID=UPI00346512AE
METRRYGSSHAYDRTGLEPGISAEKWIADNQDRVNSWLDGTEKVEGDKVTLVFNGWQDIITSTHIVAHALKEIGYDVNLLQVDAAPTDFCGCGKQVLTLLSGHGCHLLIDHIMNY